MCSPVAADTTDVKKAEVALRESEERFRLVANTAPVMIWMSGVDKLCTYFNHGWLEFTGRSLGAEMGNGWAEGIHPEDLAICLETYTNAFDRREPFRMEYRLRRHDGEYRWILDHGVPRFNADGSFAGYIGACVDINEGKRLEKAMQESEARFAEMAERNRTTTWEVDTKGLFTFVSRVSEAVWGYHPNEVVARMHFYDLHPEEGREAFKTAVFAVTKRKEPLDNVHALKTKDGRLVWSSTHGVPMLNADGTLRGYRGSCTDITKLKLSHEALRQKKRELSEAQRLAGVGSWHWDARNDSNLVGRALPDCGS